MKQVALPYRTASLDCWEVSRWRRLAGGKAVDLGEILDDWDYSVPLALSCEVAIDMSQLREQTGVAPEDPLELVAIWEATSTVTREVGARVALPRSGDV